MIHKSVWWAFLILGPVLYWTLPPRWRNLALAISSIGLLAPFVGSHLIVMIGLAAGIYIAFQQWSHSVRLLGLLRSPWPVLIVLGYLLWAKYLPELGRMISGDGGLFAAPIALGVSYFSFKLIHYIIEMRRGNFPTHDAATFAAWMFLAPIFTAGPIERFEHFLKSQRTETFRWHFVVEGSQRIAQGIVKKFLLGTIVLEAIQRISDKGATGLLSHLETASPLVIWGILILSFVYLYLDFSAYSDIAIGSSRLFGLTIMENFNFPFIATSLPAFWQRWHMTLANWCLSYIYLSMIGLTRNPYAAGIATFTVMGAWHSISPHWLAWGLWNGLGMACVTFWRRFAGRHKIRFFNMRYGLLLGWALTMAYVTLGGAFTMLHQKAPLWDSFRLIFRAFGVSV